MSFELKMDTEQEYETVRRALEFYEQRLTTEIGDVRQALWAMNGDARAEEKKKERKVHR